ncbi:unnamed protein product [Durusdinium trenchii]|uniref:Band 7 domain-containing protein n=1 Tax=Durusdinium trenchii TaxID=1381693 RepID=A0ABP0Q9N3_9DINO
MTYDLEKRGLVSDSMSDDNEDLHCRRCGRRWEPSGARFCPKCGARRREQFGSCCPSFFCCCCICCVSLLLILVISLVLGINSLQTWLSSSAVKVLSATLNVPVTLGYVHIGLLEGRAAVRDLIVGSPPGFSHDFLDLEHLVFDIGPMSLLQSRLLGSSSFPIEVEEISVKTLHVFIEQASESSPSNAKIIVDHLNSLAASSLAAPTAQQVEDSAAEAVHALTSRIQADRIDFEDIGIGYCVNPNCEKMGPATYVIKEILIQDVGKKGKGVFLYQLAEVVVRTLLLAILKAAPENLRENLLRAVGSGIQNQLDDLDFGSVHLDLGDGSGLQSAGELAGWVSGKFASLPLAASNAAVAMNTKALEAENALRNGAIATQAKMGLEAAKMGTEMIGMGVKANTAFTNMGVKANTELLNAETKANNFFNNVRNDFTTGFTSGIR